MENIMDNLENKETLDTEENVLYNTLVASCNGNLQTAMIRICKEITENFDEDSVNFFIQNVATTDARENRHWFLN